MTHADSLMAKVPLVARTGLAALALCGLILAMVLERASILRNGATIRLATTPIDPRDLFRGDYVVLGYEIGTINLTRHGLADVVAAGHPLFVGLRASASGRAEIVRLAGEKGAREAGLVWLKGTVTSVGACRGQMAEGCAERDRITRVTYGLESYFVPQGQGRAIETTPASRVDIIAAVAASGQAAIKALLIDGKPVHEEPPF